MMTAMNLDTGYSLMELLQGLPMVDSIPQITVSGVCIDSRELSKDGNELFMVFDDGTTTNATYLDTALRANIAAILIDDKIIAHTDISPVPLLRCKNLYQWLGIIADRFFGNSTSSMKVIGVTGTNGKTSVSQIIAQTINVLQQNSCGLIGTLGYGLPDKLAKGLNTTPDALTVHRLLANFHGENINTVVMEVSSHGLHQYRVEGVKFDTAIFTNLSRDHLDYHQTETEYALAKQRLFTDFDLSNAVVNLDDKMGRQLIKVIPENVNVYAYTLQQSNSEQEQFSEKYIVRGNILDISVGSMRMSVCSPWGEMEIYTGLYGKFNAANILASITALCATGYSFKEVINAVSRCHNVPGRMETYTSTDKATVVIDYAHTPDALEQVLNTLQPLSVGKLICVFGCGGDRDKGKREIMGRIAAGLADHIVLTNDNPRSESPQAIIDQILAGISDSNKVTSEPDRSKAIQKTIQSADAQDVILIAGKGHEDYQDIAGKRIPFSDQAVVRQWLEVVT